MASEHTRLECETFVAAHGFSLRHGKSGPLDFRPRDGGDLAARSIDALARAIVFSPARLFTATQVHGAEVVVVDGAASPAAVASLEADALVTAEPKTALGVYTADCLPVLFAATNAAGQVVGVGAAHAGWRGLAAGVLEQTASRLRARAPGARLTAALGPCIGVNAFEVGQEVARHFDRVRGAVRKGPAGKPHVDLQCAASARLSAVGVRCATISRCTMSDASAFYSYRRDGKDAGRLLAVVVTP